MNTWYNNLFSSKITTPTPSFHSVLIYGAGHTGQRVATCLQAQNIKVEAFLDRCAKPNQELNSLPVRMPTEVTSLTHLPVIVAVFNPHRHARFCEIADTLKKEGFLSVYSIEQYYLSHPQYFKDIYWLTNPLFYVANRPAVEAADALWSDDKSRQLYRSLLSHRVLGTDTLPTPTPHLQYIPDDVPMLPPPYRFVDIGAFDGDTLSVLKKQKGLFESIFAFEPDMNNFNALAKRVQTEGPFASGVTCLFPCGAGKTCGTVSFVQDGSEAAKVCTMDTAHAIQIPVVSIGSVLYNAKPNYIKIDVEGFEEASLLGLKELIERDRPMLAVCVYHKPSDIFKLPLLLSSWNYPAHFYLRLHGEHTFETVLYAIPK